MVTRKEIEGAGRQGASSMRVGEDRIVRVINSFPMVVPGNDFSVSQHLVRDGFWESWITTWVMNNVSPDRIFLDIGAHTGYYGLLHMHFGGKSVFFEPQKRYTKLISRTLEMNGWSRGEVHCVALSDKRGKAILHVPEKLQGSASLTPIDSKWHPTEHITATMPLNEYQMQQADVFLKIDSEGEEERIISGAHDFLTRQYRVGIMLEYTPGAYSPSFYETLSAMGPVWYIDFNGSLRQATKHFLSKQRDWVMLVIDVRK